MSSIIHIYMVFSIMCAIIGLGLYIMAQDDDFCDDLMEIFSKFE